MQATKAACHGPELGLPSADFTGEKNISAINEFYGCFKSKYPAAARAVGEEDYFINYLMNLFLSGEPLAAGHRKIDNAGLCVHRK